MKTHQVEKHNELYGNKKVNMWGYLQQLVAARGSSGLTEWQVEVAKRSLQVCLGWIKWEHILKDTGSVSALSSEEQWVLGKAHSRMLKVSEVSGLGLSIAWSSFVELWASLVKKEKWPSESVNFTWTKSKKNEANWGWEICCCYLLTLHDKGFTVGYFNRNGSHKHWRRLRISPVWVTSKQVQLRGPMRF